MGLLDMWKRAQKYHPRQDAEPRRRRRARRASGLGLEPLRSGPAAAFLPGGRATLLAATLGGILVALLVRLV
ncbi:MAG: hypothetical protein ACT4PT_00120 [Methanobacteriota archaeon]